MQSEKFAPLSFDIRGAVPEICRGRVRKEKIMTSYEICYLNEDGSLNARIATECDNDMQAKILAHALKAAGTTRIEVWDGIRLIYERPETIPGRAAAM